MKALFKLIQLIVRLVKGRKPIPKPRPSRSKPSSKPGSKECCKEPGSKKPNPYANQTKEQLEKSKKSYEELLKEHEKKLADYKADPLKYDNKDLLKNAPSEEIRQKIIDGRLRELQNQIDKHKGELNKIDEALNAL